MSSDVLIDNRTVGSLNLLLYCANNPVNRIDASGAAWETIWDFISLCLSIADVCSDPNNFVSWIGLGLDALSLITPILPAMSASLKVVNKADDLIDAGKVVDNYYDSAKTIDNSTKIGWNVGKPIDNLTKAGNRPSWSTVKQRYWKNEAFYNASQYSANDLSRMRLGLAPIGNDGFSKELYHTFGRKGQNFYIFEQVTRLEHFFIHYGG